MIKSLKITHFKTLKDLMFDVSRVNVFIGEPNVGKSNIIESLSTFSWLGHQTDNKLADFVRIRDYSDLFFDGLTKNPIQVKIVLDQSKEPAFAHYNGYRISLTDQDYEFKTTDDSANYGLRGGGGTSNDRGINKFSNSVKYYKFLPNVMLGSNPGNTLYPPYGFNLYSVVNSSPDLRKLVGNILSNLELTMVLRRLPEGGVVLELQKKVDEYVISLPYELLSDTIKNLIFHYLAIDSNENSILLLEEPESHTYPFYITELADKIARNQTNQFFIVTHNQAFFNTIVSKTPTKDLSVFAVNLEENLTKIKKIDHSDLMELLETDPFLNFSKYI